MPQFNILHQKTITKTMTNMTILPESLFRIPVMDFFVVILPSGAKIQDSRSRGEVLDYLTEKEEDGWNSNCIYNLDMSIQIELWRYRGVKFHSIKGIATPKQTK